MVALENAARQGADIAITPECVLHGYGEGKDHDGIFGYFRDHAFNFETRVFDQGGFCKSKDSFEHTEQFAVDVQSWGVLVFGPKQIAFFH